MSQNRVLIEARGFSGTDSDRHTSVKQTQTKTKKKKETGTFQYRNNGREVRQDFHKEAKRKRKEDNNNNKKKKRTTNVIE